MKVSAAFLCLVILLTLSLALIACNGSSTQPATSHNEWAWIGGANTGGQPGIYGTLGVGTAGNVPGARQASVAWTDASGNFWLFGGNGLDSTGSFLLLNDLWKYSSGQWTWMAGSNIGSQQGTYGSLAVPAVGNIPGARRCNSWMGRYERQLMAFWWLWRCRRNRRSRKRSLDVHALAHLPGEFDP